MVTRFAASEEADARPVRYTWSVGIPSWDELLVPGRADDFFANRPPEPFDPTNGARLVDSWWCAELSRLAYCDRDREPFLRSTRLREIAFLEDRGSQVLVVGPRDPTASSFAVVVFRGTDELRDWATNARVRRVRWSPGGHVHEGFRRSLAKVWRPLRRVLRENGNELFCAGHSLGGAMALLAASALRALAVHTFGAPRTGDAAFARTLDGIAVRRFEHGRDLVPRLPIPGLVHVGEGVHLGVSNDEGDVAPPPRDDRRWFDPTPQLADHAPIRYVRALRSLIAGRVS